MIFIKTIGKFFSRCVFITDCFSLAIKSCAVSNQDDSKNLLLIGDFCETEESDPIVRKNLEGKIPENLHH